MGETAGRKRWRKAMLRIKAQGIQQVRYGTITIETGICPMADRATQMGPMAADTMGPYV